MTSFVRLLIIFSWVAGAAVVTAGAATSWDPYSVLGVSRTATDAEIKRRYRQLCLQYHPDKKHNLPADQRTEYERLFKELQMAHSQICNAEARREYEQTEMFQHYRFNRNNDYYKASRTTDQDDTQQAFANSFRSYPSSPFTGRSSAFYGFNVNSLFSPNGPLFGVRTPTFWNPSLKSIYIQHVNIPLQDLYTGKPHFEFTLRNNICTRLVAAFRGGIGYLVLYQSLLYSIPVLRISRRIALCWGLYFFVRSLPGHLENSEYSAAIRPGYKGGTKLTFDEEPGVEVCFILKEAKHPVYKRIDNDLHVSCTVSPAQAAKGCRVDIPSLQDEDFVLPVTIPPGTVSGDTITVKDKGWPNRKRKGVKGDLIVTVVVSRWPRWKVA